MKNKLGSVEVKIGLKYVMHVNLPKIGVALAFFLKKIENQMEYI